MKKLLLITAMLTIFGLAVNAQKAVYNFNDGTWGTPVADRPESGSFTSTTVNDVKFNNAIIYQKDGKGSSRVILDKRSTKASIEFPAFSDAKEVIVEASVGTEGRTLVIEEKVGNKWIPIKEPVELTKQKAAYSFPLSEKATQIRVLNPTSSSLYIYKVTIK